MENYIFNTSNVYAQSLIHTINLTQPENSILVEVGTGHGETICTLAHQCPSLSKLYGIDPYVPYDDYLKHYDDGRCIYDGTLAEHYDEKKVDIARVTCEHNIKFSGNADKIQIIKKPAELAVLDFKDNTIDIVFLDAYSKPEDVYASLDCWYPKIKTDGIISGHDYQFDMIKNVIDTWRFKNKIKNKMSTHDNVWCWIK